MTLPNQLAPKQKKIFKTRQYDSRILQKHLSKDLSQRLQILDLMKQENKGKVGGDRS